MVSSARADMTKARCAEANANAQDLRREGKLSAARETLRKCADAACPGLVRDDCNRRLDEVERVQPTIVFDAKDASGKDVSAVRVTVDGTVVADRITGLPLLVDPGEHVFAFEVAGQSPVTEVFVIKEGEKERRERIVLGGASPAPQSTPLAPIPQGTPSAAPAAAPSPELVAPSPPSDTAPSSSAGSRDHGGLSMRQILGLTTGGLGVAGVAAGSVFGLLAISAANQQRSDCLSPSSCSMHPQALSSHSTATSDGAISTAAFVAGGALLLGGCTLFFLGNHPARPGPTSGLVLAPSAGPSGGGVSLRGRF